MHVCVCLEEDHVAVSVASRILSAPAEEATRAFAHAATLDERQTPDYELVEHDAERVHVARHAVRVFLLHSDHFGRLFRKRATPISAAESNRIESNRHYSVQYSTVY